MEEMKTSELSNYENIETISKFLKKTSFNYNPEKQDPQPEPKKEWLSHTAGLMEEPTHHAFNLQNFIRDNAVFNSANLGFSEEEAYRIQASLKVRNLNRNFLNMKRSILAPSSARFLVLKKTTMLQ
jgi:hypothetical protein